MHFKHKKAYHTTIVHHPFYYNRSFKSIKIFKKEPPDFFKIPDSSFVLFQLKALIT